MFGEAIIRMPSSRIRFVIFGLARGVTDLRWRKSVGNMKTSMTRQMECLLAVLVIWILSVVLLLGFFERPAIAGNIDPQKSFAWSEHAGWLNFNPSGVPGVTVTDAGLLGFIWGENIGWISLSCATTLRCSHLPYGVTNNGEGVLSGFAWGETAGWINFAPAGGGVTIDPFSGMFSGKAWSEHKGWINFDVGNSNAPGVTSFWASPSNRVDTTPPTITITNPLDGTFVLRGSVVAADFSTSDTQSPIAFVKGSLSNGALFDTWTLGLQSLSVMAVDQPGNVSSLTHTFIVAAFASNQNGNIDADNTGGRFAWGENSGWINFKPSSGPGVIVSDTEISGFAWSENLGWINLHPSGTSGVVNDGQGHLSGFAWSEHGGWISFSCANTASCSRSNFGVSIDPTTGVFNGQAWSEHQGWIHFSVMHAIPFPMTTSWTPSLVTDSDGDGIDDVIDSVPDSFSNDFSDVPLGGTTRGTLTTRGDQDVLIREEANPSGVWISANAQSGPLPAISSVCGGLAMLTIDQGDELVVTCTSVKVTVMTGVVEVEFLEGEDPVTVEMPSGHSLTFDPDSNSYTAGDNNPTTVVVHQGNAELILEPGSSGSFAHPDVLTLFSTQDSFIQKWKKNDNEGGHSRLLVGGLGKNRALVGFDLSEVSLDGLTKATLVLSLKGVQAFGKFTDHAMTVHRLKEPWKEGNGKHWKSGRGKGVTWNCASDQRIQNRRPDCESQWRGGVFDPPTASGVGIRKGMTGEVRWDVTADMQDGVEFGWLLKFKKNMAKTLAKFYSKEGATRHGEFTKAPTLILEY